MIDIRKDRRVAIYRLGPRGRRFGSNIGLHFSGLDWRAWDGSFRAAAFSLPDARKRYRIQKKLLAYRFRPLYPGFWIRPLHPDEDIPGVFGDSIDAMDIDLFACSFHRAPDLDRISDIYGLESIEAELKGALSAANDSIRVAPTLSESESFIERMRMGDALVNALARDPLLPPALLPELWPGDALRAAFREWNAEYWKRCEAFVRRAIEFQPWE